MSCVGVVGLGYVGLPLAIGLSRAGHTVVGFDVSADVVEELDQCTTRIDDVTDDEIRGYLDAGSSWTTNPADMAGCHVFIICVPTPLNTSGHPDLSYVEAAGQAVGGVLRSGGLVILESSTHPGTTDELLAPLLEHGSGLSAGSDFLLAYSPERIDPGNPEFRLENTPKIVGGLNNESAERAIALYSTLGIQTVRAKGLREAELAKLLENTYRHVNIALVNEMVKFCRPLGIDLWDAIRCASSKPFGYEAFFPGPGVGGHCIPIDPHYLSYQVRVQLGHPFRFVELAQEVNASMPSYVVDRVQDELNEQGKALNSARVLVLGVTYKPDIADMRETPATPIVRILRARGADVSYADPHVPDWSVAGASVPAKDLAECRDYDVVLLLQNHAAFTPQNVLAAGSLVLDTRAVLTGPHVRYL